LPEYRIELKRSAEREFRRLDRKTQRGVARKIDGLATEPRPARVEKLAGTENRYRIRVGDIRIVYQIEDRVLLILILRIRDRKDVYR
jgi:mRNA interferase RelE/StbE